MRFKIEEIRVLRNNIIDGIIDEGNGSRDEDSWLELQTKHVEKVVDKALLLFTNDAFHADSEVKG